MQTQGYIPCDAPARAIPPGEEPLVTRAKVCAQLRAALQILEGGAFDAAHIADAQTQLKAAARVLFVAKVQQGGVVLPAHLRIGGFGREGRA